MTTIKKYNLTDTEVRRIVLEWYLNGLEPEIFMCGSIELDEYIESAYDVFLED